MIKTKKYVRVKDVIYSLHTTENYTIPLSFTEDGTTHNFTITGTDFLSALLYSYSFFHFVHIKDEIDFDEYFTLFKKMNLENMNRLYFSLYKTYNPVENYDKNSTITNTPNKNGKDMITEQHNLIETDMALTNKVTVKGESALQSETTEHTHGNIGTTKNTDMISDEIALRMNNNLIHCIVDMFAKNEIIC